MDLLHELLDILACDRGDLEAGLVGLGQEVPVGRGQHESPAQHVDALVGSKSIRAAANRGMKFNACTEPSVAPGYR